MAGFSFPPPPPPPPKPVPQQQSEFEYSSQSGRGGRGRGSFESRGRSGPGRGRGRGNSNHEPLGERSNFAQSGWGRETSSQGQDPYQGLHPVARPPPGSYINPNFVGQQRDSHTNVNHQSGPDNTGYTEASTPATARPQKSPANDGPGRSQAGHKRKLDALRGPQQPREKKPGPQTVPSVPSFGAPILPPVRASAPSQSISNGPPTHSTSRAQQASRTLGLTPKDGTQPDYSSESADDGDEDDVDEEAQFAELGTKLTFEHNGEIMTLNNEAELAAWKEERKRQFPTAHRVSQKEQEMLQIGEERKRLLAAASRLHQAPRNRHAEAKKRSLRESVKTRDEATHSAKPQESASVTSGQKQTNDIGTGTGIQEVDMSPAAPEAMDAIPAVQHETVKQNSASADGNPIPKVQHEPAASQHGQQIPKALPGIDMGETDDESDAAPVAAAEAPQESEEESASDSESEDDGPPEQVSSKPQPSAVSDTQKPVCKYFAASGRCRDGDLCRFRHELSNKAPFARPAQPQPDKPAFDRFAPKLDPKSNDRKSIFERLVEQEEQGDDRLALQVIKALGQAGLFKEPETC